MTSAISDGRTYLHVLNGECAEYMQLCGDNIPGAIKRNYRGKRWASVPGVDRQSKRVSPLDRPTRSPLLIPLQKPFWTKFHRDHLHTRPVLSTTMELKVPKVSAARARQFSSRRRYRE